MPDGLLHAIGPDLDHPLEEYSGRLAAQHARNAGDYFEELVRRSGVDEQENIRIVGELRALERDIARSRWRRNLWRYAGIAGITVAVGSASVALKFQGWSYLLLVLAVGAVLFTVWKVRAELSVIRSQLRDLEPQRDAKRDQAWAQMEPLNRLHTWGVAPALFEVTFPAVQFDPHMSADRFGDLVANYGLPTHTGGDRSALFAQSGSLAGNPFVFQRFLQHRMGTRVYTGSLVISWTERVRNADGRYVTVHRSQTLTASVVKPFPQYQERTALRYGHEAAPALSFSRGPSKLSGLEDGPVNTWRKERAVSKVERQARRGVMTGSTELTVMANREFEALFHATDRDDEVAFRLLFTPLAQAEMVKLLNDRSSGFGDDFTFAKQGMINTVEPRHLHDVALDGDPMMFRSLELAEARRRFNAFHARYFRSLYFSLAPLLAIPLYREPRSVPGARSDLLDTCEWEHEAMAGLIGEAAFQHPESITRNLLQTTSASIAPGVRAVDVTAHGYGGIPRVDYVGVRGGDGHVHSVPVPWTEYYGVWARRSMLVGVVGRDLAGAGRPDDLELEQRWNDTLLQHGLDPGMAVRRGSLAACPLPR